MAPGASATSGQFDVTDMIETTGQSWKGLLILAAALLRAGRTALLSLGGSITGTAGCSSWGPALGPCPPTNTYSGADHCDAGTLFIQRSPNTRFPSQWHRHLKATAPCATSPSLQSVAWHQPGVLTSRQCRIRSHVGLLLSSTGRRLELVMITQRSRHQSNWVGANLHGSV